MPPAFYPNLVSAVQWRARYLQAGCCFLFRNSVKCAYRFPIPELSRDIRADDTSSWRRMRRAAHEALNKGRVTEYHPLHEKEALLLIDGMLRNPVGWKGELQR